MERNTPGDDCPHSNRDILSLLLQAYRMPSIETDAPRGAQVRHELVKTAFHELDVLLLHQHLPDFESQIPSVLDRIRTNALSAETRVATRDFAVHSYVDQLRGPVQFIDPRIMGEAVVVAEAGISRSTHIRLDYALKATLEPETLIRLNGEAEPDRIMDIIQSGFHQPFDWGKE